MLQRERWSGHEAGYPPPRHVSILNPFNPRQSLSEKTSIILSTTMFPRSGAPTELNNPLRDSYTIV